jgi:hypothetical protein
MAGGPSRRRAVGCGGVDDRVLPGSAHGDVGEFASASSGEDVDPVAGKSLDTVNREGIAVVEVVAVDAVAGDLDVSAVVSDRVDAVFREAGDSESFAGHDPSSAAPGWSSPRPTTVAWW